MNNSQNVVSRTTKMKMLMKTAKIIIIIIDMTTIKKQQKLNK